MSRLPGLALLLIGHLGCGLALAASLPSTSQVERGAYLVRAADCVSCHTAPGGKPFAGGLYMATPFGEISVPNITADPETGIGAWSDDEFYRAMHEGIGRGGEYLYPVFPFPWYTKITRQDVAAIRAYLRTVPPVKATRPPLKLSFPASQRESLLAWRTLFFKAGEFQPDPAKSQQVNRGAYLVEGPGHCGECHNQRNEAGTSRWSGSLQGGEIEGWYAPNLTPDGREGIGAWSTNELAHFLKTGTSPHAGVALGPMQQVIQESLSQLETADIQAIASYLKSIPAKETFKAAPTSEFTGAHPPGSQEYITFCASCHGVQGQGFAKRIPALTQNGAILAQGPQNVIRVILGGLPATRGLAPMPAIGASMSDQQVADATNYIRNAFGNTAPGTAQAGMVANLRPQTRTILAGNPDDGCPGQPPSAIAHALTANDVQKKLAAMTEANTLQTIDRLAPKLRATAGAATSVDDLVNAMTDVYCGTLKSRQMTPAARSELLGNFSVLSYSQLKSNGRD
jgi:mono/diheme cytochrome c family protein